MISPAKLQANRVNARHSSGPKSVAGKARSAGNARRHGLAVPIWSDAKLAADAEELAHVIAGEGASIHLVALAREIAAAQVDLVRIQHRRNEVLAAFLSPAKLTDAGHPARAPRVPAENADLALIIAALDRCERRALSRRKSAIRRFDVDRTTLTLGASATDAELACTRFG
jgi:hypothetical protein